MGLFRIISLSVFIPAITLAQNYSVDWYVIASGGGHTESANYQVDGTIGQAIVGQSSSDNYIVEAGFWIGFGEPGPDCVYMAGDCNHNGTPLELGDVVTMIGMYRGSVAPPYECSCPPHGDNFAPTADPNGNCVAFELGDVVTEIGAYRGSTEASGCPDCPGSLRLIPGSEERRPVVPSFKSKIKIGKRSVSE